MFFWQRSSIAPYYINIMRIRKIPIYYVKLDYALY